jgi:hypothetical protein
MLAEMIGSKEFFGLVAFTKFMGVGQMLNPSVPITDRLHQ